MTEPRQDAPQLADWWSRVGATLLDFVVIWVLFMAVAVALTIAVPIPDGFGFWVLLWFAVSCVYHCGLMARRGPNNGQTLGKQSADIRVVRDNGKPVTILSAFFRDMVLKFGLGNAAFAVGWIFDSLWPLVDRENRSIHDLAANTRVISVREPVRIPLPPSRPVVPALALAPPIARHVAEARRIEASIAAVARRAELPQSEVSTEVAALVGQLQGCAERAQLLYEALAETPVARVERRLEVLADGERPELAASLREQLAVQKRVQAQFDHYDAELERIVVELDTVRANLVSVSASGDATNQERLAEAVRQLRDETSAVGEGMAFDLPLRADSAAAINEDGHRGIDAR